MRNVVGTAVAVCVLSASALGQFTYTQTQKVHASDESASNLFGMSVAMDGEWLAFGSGTNDVYLFKDNENRYVEKQKLARGGSSGFGRVLDMDEGRLAVGAPFEGTYRSVRHAHLTLSPTPPIELVEEVPEVLSDIVLKLIEKRRQKRYQSAYGVTVDLRRVQRELAAGKKKIGIFYGAGHHPDMESRLIKDFDLHPEKSSIQWLTAWDMKSP